MSYLILPQNGVVDGQTHYSPEIAAPEIPMNSPMGSLHRNLMKRPKDLQVATNGYVGKNLSDNSADDGGSLPCTPEMPTDSHPATPGGHAGDEALDNDTKELISSFLRDFTGLPKQRRNQTKALSTMKRVVEDVLSKHRYAYNGMMNKLCLDEVPDNMGFVSSVATSLFSDGTTNWGRIVSLVAFGAVVCQHLKEKGRENCVELVSQEISTYLLQNQRDWLVKNNSWNGFVEFFRVEDPEATMRNTLMAFVGVAGIGATLAFLIR
ncbi:PREDICTED: induced myeloid leukemia cell differentiation protein Mcl-1-like [Cyprinodon variegatus]|uniref:MCL1 apoptosis regulator, BCL2 family member b n=1 Tax=Cyprinodon variegatus TaxID=28743 RepID=A0A3Q2EDX8_CYPVA|nr:PREDICTED: induced myeloid leukemia cell differentiation protein Mcl-1-like [Cyprinodon variegatus]